LSKKRKRSGKESSERNPLPLLVSRCAGNRGPDRRGLDGYYGTQSAGIFTPREAFFVIGASILILSAASVYQFLTLRDTISVSRSTRRNCNPRAIRRKRTYRFA